MDGRLLGDSGKFLFRRLTESQANFFSGHMVSPLTLHSFACFNRFFRRRGIFAQRAGRYCVPWPGIRPVGLFEPVHQTVFQEKPNEKQQIIPAALEKRTSFIYYNPLYRKRGTGFCFSLQFCESAQKRSPLFGGVPKKTFCSKLFCGCIYLEHRQAMGNGSKEGQA